MTDSQIGKVDFGKSKNNINNVGTGVPLVMKYHPKLKIVEQLVTKLQYLLYQDEVMKKKNLVSYHTARK